MAKILVADDNSNIQKMVVLALKDQGIEVVAVGNGEAAVRKISDLRPDLVLADIFMPVRNGYEVCKFVKDNSALSHIPVILLVGAFDPLDEQEAQRVGADGVLKKPFVPPDPLISMVKSALTRAGVSLGSTVPAPPPPIPVAAKSGPTPLPSVVPPPPAFVEPAEEEFTTAPSPSSRPAPFNIEKGSQPLAFGSLLDSPVPEEDAVFAISPNTHAAPERDWVSSSSEEEEEEETEEAAKTGGWRVSSLQGNVDEMPAGQADWREAAFSGIGSGVSAASGAENAHTAGWAPSIEKNSLSITEEEAAALSREQEALPSLTSSRGQQDWAKVIQEVLPEKTLTPADSHTATVAELPAVPPPPIPESLGADQPAKSEVRPDVNSWMAGAVSPWESELPRVSHLASSWDSATITPAAVIEEPSAAEVLLGSGMTAGESANETHQKTPEVEKTFVDESPLPEVHLTEPVVAEAAPEAVSAIESLLSPLNQEILHEEAAQAVAEQTSVAEQSLDPSESAASAPVGALSPNIDEIVAKVLAKMNPDVLQAVTREILKPLVEAMIKHELHKK